MLFVEMKYPIQLLCVGGREIVTSHLELRVDLTDQCDQPASDVVPTGGWHVGP